MYKRESKCPVCFTKNERYIDYVCNIECENHYYCDKCGFTEIMAYSPAYTTFCDKDIKKFLKHKIVRIKNFKRSLRVRRSPSFRFALGRRR